MIGEFALGSIIMFQGDIYFTKILIWLKVWSEGGKLSCHSIEVFVKWLLGISRFLVIVSHKIKININTLRREIILPIEEIMFHFVK